LVVFGYKVDVEGPNETLQKAINEKFAEKIVRECIGIVEKNESEIHYDTGMYPAYPTATVREILEHFGVEE
jgi:hypothetical protein